MRYLLAAICLCLAACGAESPTPSRGDASAPGDADGGRRCGVDRAFVGGVCVSATAADCGGRRCPTGQQCFVESDGDAGAEAAVCYPF
jgi:hypothetical protein